MENLSKAEMDPVYSTLRDAAGFRSLGPSKSTELEGGKRMDCFFRLVIWNIIIQCLDTIVSILSIIK